MSDASASAPASVSVIAIVGPTAVGKSAVAEGIAAHLGGEIISADSMQVYRGMDIGTAKQPASARAVPYHCIDLLEPGRPYSAALYQQDARAAIDDMLARGISPVMAGGTGLYVRAALDEMDFPPGELVSDTRARIEALAARLGADGLHRRLAERDPASAALIHPRNVRRVVRALEMLEEGGPSYAHQASRFAERRPAYTAAFIGLTMERAALYARVDARVDAMMNSGLLAEVAGLVAAGYRDALTASQAIGYKELVPVIECGADPVEAIEAIKLASRRYAKRQLSWFRADPRVTWLDVTDLTTADAVTAALALLESDERPSRGTGD